ncbi:Pygopus [Homalodisca vitripennis]|nr:Pygopus [Homalodisca vitripennis]
MEKSEITICPLCDKLVDDNEQAVLCEGGCITWYHRICLGMMPDHYEKITDGEKGYEIWHCPHCDIGNVNTELQIPKIVCYSPPNSPDRTLEDLKLELNQADILVGNETDNAYTLLLARLKTQNNHLHARVQELINIIEERKKQTDGIREEMLKKTAYYEEHDIEQLKIIKKQEDEIQHFKRLVCKQNTDAIRNNMPNENYTSQEQVNSYSQNVKTEVSFINKNINNLFNNYKMLEKRVTILENSSAEKIEYVNCASRPSVDSLTSANKRLQNDESYEDFFNNNIQEFLKNKDNQKGLQENNDSSCSPRVAGE